MKSETQRSSKKTWIRLGVLIVFLSLLGIFFWYFRDSLSLSKLAEQEDYLKNYQEENPFLVYVLAIVIYVAITGLSLPGAAALTLLFGWYFGLVRGILLVSFASTTGATLAFLLSRYLFGQALQERFSKRLKAFNAKLDEEGEFYLFTLRLIPAVPFFVVNAVMGLTRIRVWTFWWVSQLGMLAGTIVYVYAGSIVPSLSKLADEGLAAAFERDQIIKFTVAFALLGLLPLTTKKIINYIQKRKTNSTEEKTV